MYIILTSKISFWYNINSGDASMFEKELDSNMEEYVPIETPKNYIK